MAVLARLQREVLNGDAWWLANNSARRDVEHLGVDPEVFDEVHVRLEQARQHRIKSNPLSGMFAQ